jgi:hypothetical protein
MGQRKRQSVSLFLIGFLVGLTGSSLASVALAGVPRNVAPFALGGHGQEPSCSFDKMGVSGVETSLPTGRDGVRADIRVIDPAPDVIDGLVRAIYISPSAPDVMEFGWIWVLDTRINGCCHTAPTVFAVKIYNASLIYSEDGGNPGAGTLAQGSDHKFTIVHNPNGNDSNRYEFKRDGMYFGFFGSDRMPNGGGVWAGTEGWANPCDDMQSHYWNLERQNDAGGSWFDWAGVTKSLDFGTKWWYFQKNASSGADAPEWWLNHCASANCPDV